MKQANPEAIAFFEQYKYVLVRKVVPPEMCSFLYDYCVMRARAARIMDASKWEGFSPSDGTFTDDQAVGTYSVYGDPAMDLVLSMVRGNVEAVTGVDLYAAFSFWRLYEHGNVLEAHTDRASAEISATLCIGSTPGTKEDPNANYQWGFCFNDLVQNKPIEATLYPGDMLVYRGCDVLHWREPLKAEHHAQVFLHYVDQKGPFSQHGKWDTKPALGLPPEFRRPDAWNAMQAIADKMEAEKLEQDPEWYEVDAFKKDKPDPD